jgi:hypothetical protein
MTVWERQSEWQMLRQSRSLWQGCAGQVPLPSSGVGDGVKVGVLVGVAVGVFVGSGVKVCVAVGGTNGVAVTVGVFVGGRGMVGVGEGVIVGVCSVAVGWVVGVGVILPGARRMAIQPAQ